MTRGRDCSRLVIFNKTWFSVTLFIMCKGKNTSDFWSLLPLKEKERERFEKEANRPSLKEVVNCIIIFKLWNFVKAEREDINSM